MFSFPYLLTSLTYPLSCAAGVCGMDPSFLFYSSGILDLKTCCNVLNHALLLVGYGTDPKSGLDYWIAMNRSPRRTLTLCDIM